MINKKSILRSVVRVKNSNAAQKAMLFAAAIVLANTASAQNVTGTGGFQYAETTFRGYIPLVKNMLYAIAAVISLVGAFNIYFKMQNGDQDVKKTIMMTIGGCVAFIAAAVALPQFFE